MAASSEDSRSHCIPKSTSKSELRARKLWLTACALMEFGVAEEGNWSSPTGLLDVVNALVSDYEDRNVEIPTASPAAIRQFLMKQRKLRQIDLAEDFGSQSNVSEVPSGKRESNARQARTLAAHFEVSPAVFI
jgi:antitoxin component HigA of HigAB toxin-antitoxin module